MSKLACHCGHIIYEQSDSLAYKAEFIKDKDTVSYLDEREAMISEAIQYIQSGLSQAWLQKNFGKISDNSLPIATILFDKLTSLENQLTHEIFECEKCGRLWLQQHDSLEFTSFLPENGKYNQILDKPKNLLNIFKK